MPRRPKLRPDVNEIAFRTVQAATGQGGKPKPAGEGEPNPEAVKRGRKGGKEGGKVRAATLTPEELVEIAKKGVAARWTGHTKRPRKTRK